MREKFSVMSVAKRWLKEIRRLAFFKRARTAAESHQLWRFMHGKHWDDPEDPTAVPPTVQVSIGGDLL